MSYLLINGTNYYFEQKGQGPALVLIAGYSCDLHFWDRIIENLTSKFKVVIFDNRGIGQTKDNGLPFRLEELADDIAEMIKVLKLQSPILVGHSMGGIIAQIIAQKFTPLIAGLVSLNCANKVNLRTLLALKGFIKLLQENAHVTTVIEASLPWFYSSAFLQDPENIHAIIQGILNNAYPQSLLDLNRQFNAVQTFDSSPFTSFINVPAKIVASRSDIICTPDETRELISRFPNANFDLIEGGHSSPVENPNAVSKAILDFIA